MNGPNAGLYALNVTVADGWRARYYVGNQFYAFSFDPEGNAVSRQNSADTLYNAYATSTFEAYGSRGGDFSTASGSHPASHQDPVRFGGQYGYYSDFGTGLYLLTHRYYDAGAGRFVTRDPIGYKGGINLYGFAGNNPVNESDPSGYNPLSRYLGRKLSAFERAAQKAGQTAMEFLEKGAEAKAEYGDITPTVQTMPSVGPGASPSARASEEENAEVARTLHGPSIAFNRRYHYGFTPNTAQQRSVPKGRVFDHDPPLVQHYYEGDGKGGIPGHMMTQRERKDYGGRVDVGKASTKQESDRQGPGMRGYGVRMRKKFGLPPFKLPR